MQLIGVNKIHITNVLWEGSFVMRVTLVANLLEANYGTVNTGRKILVNTSNTFVFPDTCSLYWHLQNQVKLHEDDINDSKITE
jgi:hypothetical protein